MAVTFKPGDVVVLKSGGPEMTIAWIDEYSQALCNWFEGKKQLNGSFPITSLKMVSEDSQRFA